jgi:hypothetical protein
MIVSTDGQFVRVLDPGVLITVSPEWTLVNVIRPAVPVVGAAPNGQLARVLTPGVLLINNGGRTAVLTGTTGYVGPPEVLGACLVQLFEADAHRTRAFPFARLIRQVRSSPEGKWEFTDLRPGLRYDVLAYDPRGEFPPVLKMNLVATDTE